MSKKPGPRTKTGVAGFLNFLSQGSAGYKLVDKNRIEFKNHGGTARLAASRLAELAKAELVALNGVRIGLTETGVLISRGSRRKAIHFSFSMKALPRA